MCETAARSACSCTCKLSACPANRCTLSRNCLMRSACNCARKSCVCSLRSASSPSSGKTISKASPSLSFPSLLAPTEGEVCDDAGAAQSVEAARMEEGAACNDASAAPGAACNDASAAPRIFEAKQCFFLSKYFSESQPRLRTTIHHYCHALSLHPGPLCSPASHTIAVSAPMSATRRCGRSCTSGQCGRSCTSGQHVFEHELWPC